MGFSLVEDGFTDIDLAFEAIVKWIEVNGDSATEENLCKCLVECKLGFLQKELMQQYIVLSA